MKPTVPYKVFIGWDAAQIRACVIALLSAGAKTTVRLDAQRLSLPELVARGLYRRPTVYPTTEKPSYYDEISDAPMSTGHAIARFLVPRLCEYQGWALFVDGDVLFRKDVAALFAHADETKAVQVVQHDYPQTAGVKMTGAEQTRYARKNWSSVMLFNCGHPSNRRLDVALVNTVPGRDLHRFCWLEDEEIGALPAEWNHLVGHSPKNDDAALVHFTEGLPDMPGYEHGPYTDEWYRQARSAGYHLVRPARRA